MKPTAPDLACTVDVLDDAILWLKSDWDSVPDSTIVKCFRNCGFTVPASPQVQSDDPEPANYDNILGDVPWDTFVEADDNTATSNVADHIHCTWEQELIAAARGQPTPPQDQASSSEDEAAEEPPEEPRVTPAAASDHLIALLWFRLQS